MSEKSKDLTRVHLEVNTIDGFERAERFLQVVNGKNSVFFDLPFQILRNRLEVFGTNLSFLIDNLFRLNKLLLSITTPVRREEEVPRSFSDS